MQSKSIMDIDSYTLQCITTLLCVDSLSVFTQLLNTIHVLHLKTIPSIPSQMVNKI